MEKHVVPLACLILSALQLLDGTQGADECKAVLEIETLNKCCQVPAGIKPSEEKQAIAESCAKALSSDKPMSDEDNVKMIECMEECYFNGSNFMTVDGKINHLAFIADYQEQFGMLPKWKEVAGIAVHICFKKDVASRVKPDARCKSGALQFLTCLGNQLLLNCPADGWQDKDEACVKAKELIEKCEGNSP